jgi:drug/metabolite transporter (DMT)-like permease
MKTNQKIKKGVFYAFLTALVSGVSIFYSKTVVLKIPPLALTTIRNLSVGFLFFILLLSQRKLFNQLKPIKKREMLLLILVGVIGGALPFYLFFSGLKLVPAQTANLIHKSLFIWVTILAAIFLKEKMQPIFWLAFVLIFLGNYYFSPFKLQFNQGEAMILLATWFWAVENILAKKALKTVSSEIVGFFRMGVGGLLLFLTTIGQIKIIFSLTFSQWQLILPGVALLFFYVFFWYKALKYAPASLVTLILTFSMVVGNILNGAFAGVRISQNDIYSSSLILIAASLIFLHAVYQRKSLNKLNG